MAIKSLLRFFFRLSVNNLMFGKQKTTDEHDMRKKEQFVKTANIINYYNPQSGNSPSFYNAIYIIVYILLNFFYLLHFVWWGLKCVIFKRHLIRRLLRAQFHRIMRIENLMTFLLLATLCACWACATITSTISSCTLIDSGIIFQWIQPIFSLLHLSLQLWIKFNLVK